MRTNYAPAAAEPATAPQLSFLARLLSERGLPAAPEGLSKRAASAMIDDTKSLPRVSTVPAATGAPVERPAKPGVFKTSTGEIYLVKPNKAKTNMYAMRMVQISGDRLTESGEVAKIEFEYDRGAIFRLSESDRMSAEEGKALTVRYGRCICCNRRLKAAQSVERGIGPVCIEYFA